MFLYFFSSCFTKKGSWKIKTKWITQETSISKRKHPVHFWQIVYFVKGKCMT